MRIPDVDAPAQARKGTVMSAFREMLKVRALWAAGGVIVLGATAGLIFYNPNVSTPLPSTESNEPLTQADTDAAVAAVNEVATAEPHRAPTHESDETTAQSETMPAGGTPQKTQGATTAEPTCNRNAQMWAVQQRRQKIIAEQERFASQQGIIDPIISAITGILFQGPTNEQQQKHEDNLRQIEIEYRKALEAADCS